MADQNAIDGEEYDQIYSEMFCLQEEVDELKQQIKLLVSSLHSMVIVHHINPNGNYDKCRLCGAESMTGTDIQHLAGFSCSIQML